MKLRSQNIIFDWIFTHTKRRLRQSIDAVWALCICRILIFHGLAFHRFIFRFCAHAFLFVFISTEKKKNMELCINYPPEKFSNPPKMERAQPFFRCHCFNIFPNIISANIFSLSFRRDTAAIRCVCVSPLIQFYAHTKCMKLLFFKRFFSVFFSLRLFKKQELQIGRPFPMERVSCYSCRPY